MRRSRLVVFKMVRCTTLLNVFAADIHLVVDGWPNGFAFILGFLSPVWTICERPRL